MKRFVIRDCDTHEIKTVNLDTEKKKYGKITLDFTNPTSAKMYFSTMPFSINQFYEIYDTKEDIVISTPIRRRMNNYERRSKSW